MKLLVIIITIFSCSTVLLGQKKERYEPKIILKSNPVTLIENALEFSLDFKTKAHKSNQFTLKIYKNSTGIIGSPRAHDNYETSTGWGIAYEKRLYSKNNPALLGFYYGPYGNIQFFSSKVFEKFSFNHYLVTRRTLSSGISGGWQFAHRYIFPAIDINFKVGLVYSPYPFTSEHDIEMNSPFVPEVKLGVNFGFGY